MARRPRHQLHPRNPQNVLRTEQPSHEGSNRQVFFALVPFVFPEAKERRPTRTEIFKRYASFSRPAPADHVIVALNALLHSRRISSLFLFRYKLRSSLPCRGRTPCETGIDPPTSHPGGQMSGTIIPNSGRRSSEEGGPNLENGACRPRAVTAAAPSVRSGRSHAYLICVFIVSSVS